MGLSLLRRQALEKTILTPFTNTHLFTSEAFLHDTSNISSLHTYEHIHVRKFTLQTWIPEKS